MNYPLLRCLAIIFISKLSYAFNLNLEMSLNKNAIFGWIFVIIYKRLKFLSAYINDDTGDFNSYKQLFQSLIYCSLLSIVVSYRVQNTISTQIQWKSGWVRSKREYCQWNVLRISSPQNKMILFGIFITRIFNRLYALRSGSNNNMPLILLLHRQMHKVCQTKLIDMKFISELKLNFKTKS